MATDRLGILLGLKTAKEVVDEARGSSARTDGGERRSRLRAAARRAKRGARRAGSAGSALSQSAAEVGNDVAAGGRQAVQVLDQNELRSRRGDLRRRGIPEAEFREAQETDMAANAVDASIMGPPVRASLEPVTRPQDMQYFVTNMGTPEPVDEGAEMGIHGLLPGGNRGQEAANGSGGALEMDDPLGAGVGFDMGGGDDDGESEGWF